MRSMFQQIEYLRGLCFASVSRERSNFYRVRVLKIDHLISAFIASRRRLSIISSRQSSGVISASGFVAHSHGFEGIRRGRAQLSRPNIDQRNNTLCNIKVLHDFVFAEIAAAGVDMEAARRCIVASIAVFAGDV